MTSKLLLAFCGFESLTIFLARFLAKRNIEMADRTLCLSAIGEETARMSEKKNILIDQIMTLRRSLLPRTTEETSHVILVSSPVPIGLWIFDCFGFGIGIWSRGTGLGTRA